MLRLSSLLAAVVLSAQINAQTITSVANGNAQNAATWSCGCIPPNNADLVVNHLVTLAVTRIYKSLIVNSGATFTKNGAGSLTLTGNLAINAGGTFTNDRPVDIGGNYHVAGTHSGTGNTDLYGSNKTMSGILAGAITNNNTLIISGGNKTITAGSFMTKPVGLIRLDGVDVTNNGTFSAYDFSGTGATPTWIQGTNGWLTIRGTFSNNADLSASATGNTVHYAKVGGNQPMRRSNGLVYYDLRLTSNNTAHKKNMRADIEVLHDLYFTTCTFDTRNGPVDHNIRIRGNWTNDNAIFLPRDNTVIFDNSVPVTLDHATTEEFYDLVINGTDTVLLATPIQVTADIAINGTLDVSATNYTITVKDDWSRTGTFIRRNGNVIFNGTGVQQQSGPTEYHDLTVDKTGGYLEIAQGRQKVFSTLSLTNGQYRTNDSLSMASNAGGDSRIAPITGGTIQGTVYVQRYIDAGATNWRFLTAPVAGSTLGAWQDNFVTSGYAGSHFPSFPFTSIYTYDQAAPGTMDDGFIAAASSAQTIPMGQGLWVWCGDSLGGTSDFMIDVKGDVYTGNNDLPVSYTPIGGAANDGWCMVGNPYVSAIDWDSPQWTKTNLNNAIYIWSPDAENFAGYVGGVGINGGSRYIASSQAFWVQANAAGPQLTIRENCKTALAVGFKDADPMDLLRLRIIGNGFEDEAVLRMEPGTTPAFDPAYDAYEQFSTDPNVPNICSKMPGGSNLMINTVAPLNNDSVFNVKVKVGVTSPLTIQFTEITGAFAASCLFLEDVVDGVTVPVIAGGSYSFIMDAAYTGTRFRLHGSTPMEAAVIGVSCSYMNDGSISVSPTGTGPYTYTWFDVNGNQTQQHTQMGPDQLTGLIPGIYTVTLDGQGSCPQLGLEIEVPAPDPVIADATVTDCPCATGSAGAIDLSVLGGSAPYTWAWTNGALTEDVTGLAPGTYTVDVTDANGCIATNSFTVNAGIDVQAIFTAPASALAGDPVPFTNGSLNAIAYTWDFGDGTPLENGMSPDHVYGLPGTYSVTLTAVNGDCSHSASFDILIDALSTGVTDMGHTGISIEQEGTHLVLTTDEARTLALRVDNGLGQAIVVIGEVRYEAGRNVIGLPRTATQVVLVTVTTADGVSYSRRIVR